VPECEHNFCDMARTLRMGENTFRRPCNFKELGAVKRAHITTFCVMCLMAAHRPNRYFHVTASNGIVSNSPYTSLAIMTASPIRFSYSKLAAIQMSWVRCQRRRVIDRAIIVLNDHRFWGHASGPSSSGKTLPSFHPLLARPCRPPQRPTARAV
jgi:hypothetical protein